MKAEEMFLVGAPRFELGTSCAQGSCKISISLVRLALFCVMVLVFGPNLSAPGPKLDLTLGDQTRQTAGRRSLSALRGFRVSNANDHPFPERSSRTRYRHK